MTGTAATRRRPALARMLTGVGGALLIVSLFLPWAGAGEMHRNGFQLLGAAGIFPLLAGAVAIAAAITRGRYGLFRPDLSMDAAADLLGLAVTAMLAWLVVFDFPATCSREVGVFLALAAAIAITGGAGDYATLRGAPWFPRLGR